MIHSVKDLSPDQKLAIETCSVARFLKESKSACARRPLHRNGLGPSSRTLVKKAQTVTSAQDGTNKVASKPDGFTMGAVFDVKPRSRPAAISANDCLLTGT